MNFSNFSNLSITENHVSPFIPRLQHILKSLEDLFLEATRERDVRFLEWMLADKFLPNRNILLGRALHIAVKNNDYDLAERFLDQGANPDFHDGQNSILHISLEGENTDLSELLLQYGADVNATNEVGDSALHIASFRGQYDLVQSLLKAGADIRAKNYKKQTCIFYAAMEETGDKSILKLLLDSSEININALDSDNNSLLRFKFQTIGEQQSDCEVVSTCLLYGVHVKQQASLYCSCEDQYFRSSYCPKILLLAKIAGLNTTLAKDLTTKLCVQADTVDDLQMQIQEQFFKEVHITRTIILTSRYKLSDLLNGNRNLKADLADNGNLQDLLRIWQNNLSEPLPLLGELFTVIIKKSENRRVMYAKSEESFKETIGINLAKIVSKMILLHLSNIQLQVLIDSSRYI